MSRRQSSILALWPAALALLALPLVQLRAGSIDPRLETLLFEAGLPKETEEGSLDEGTEVSDTLEAGLPKRLLPHEYMFAGGPRYTALGEMPNRRTELRTVPAIATGTVVAGMVLGIHLYQKNAWWSDRKTDFHVQTDWGYAAQADKFGHLFGGYLTSYLGYEMLVASGVSPNTAGWLGPLIGLGFQTYVEIEDGFSPFGFDPTDQYANTIGPLFVALRHYVEPLQNFGIKWSYFPNDEYNEGIRSGHNTIIIDDYNGQTIWFSAKVGNLLPESIPWPKWLRLAVGYGATNVDRWDEGDMLLQPGRRAFVALDYDLVELVPDIGWFGNWLVQSFDNFRWPAPAFQFAPEPKFYLAWPVVF